MRETYTFFVALQGFFGLLIFKINVTSDPIYDCIYSWKNDPEQKGCQRHLWKQKF